MDGLHSFAALCASLPLWNERLDALSRQVHERHAEFTRLSRTSGASIGSIRRKKTGSTESLRPEGAEDMNTRPPPTSAPVDPPLRVEINPDNRRIFYDLRMQSRRKRLPNSMASGVTGTHSFRSRLSLIVYYDSAIQDNFEWLVRNIAGARNTMRKGKTTASLRARIESMSMEESPFQGDRTDISMRNPNIPRMQRRATASFSLAAYSPEPFDLVDRELEAAQSLCEVGAHQFLRDGSCSNELSGTQERFLAVLRIAEEQRALYEEEAKEKASIERRPSTEGGKSTEGTLTPDSSDVEVSKECDMEMDPAVVAIDPLVALNFQSNECGISMGTIEIDENDDSNSFHIDLSAFRQTRRCR